MTRVERVAQAVDEVTEHHGLSRGEAIWVFTAMLVASLEGASPEGQDVLREAVIDSLNAGSLRPLVVAGVVSQPQAEGRS